MGLDDIQFQASELLYVGARHDLRSCPSCLATDFPENLNPVLKEEQICRGFCLNTNNICNLKLCMMNYISKLNKFCGSIMLIN